MTTKTESKETYADKIKAQITDREEKLTEILDAAEARMAKSGKGTKKTEKTQIEAIEAEIDSLSEDLKRAEARADRRDKIDKAKADKIETDPRTGQARVTAEPRQYDPAGLAGLTPNAFLRDLYATQFPGRWVPQPGETGDPQARMDRHMREFERDKIPMPDEMRGTPVPRHFFDSAAIRQTQSSDVGGPHGGLVPEQYPGVVGRHLYKAAVFLALCNRYDIPQMGMQLSVPRFTAGIAGANYAEEAAITNSSVTASNVTVPVVTAAGRCQITRQLIERGNMAEDYILDMLGMALKSSIDASIVKHSANPVGFIDQTRPASHNIDQDATTKTAAKVWQSLGLGIDKIATSRFIAPDAICVHQRRATYLGFALDSQGRPLFQESAATAMNTFGLGRGAPTQDQMPEVVLRLASGQSLYVDNNIPTTFDSDQDPALVFNRGDQHYWGQSMPYMVSWEQTSGLNLMVDLVGYEYYGFTSGVQPAGGCVVSGSLFSTTLTVSTS